MTDLTARQLLDTIRQSLDDTSQRFSRAKARKSIREGRAKSSPGCGQSISDRCQPFRP